MRIHNNGSPLVVLGLKTEGYCTAVSSESGANTAILGGLLYVVRMPGTDPGMTTELQDADFKAIPSNHAPFV